MMFLWLVLLPFVESNYTKDTSLYNQSYYNYLDAQNKLFDDLFDGYRNELSPMFTRSSVSSIEDLLELGTEPYLWNYTVFLYYFKLVEVDEPSEKVGVVLEVIEYWYDARLVWDPFDYHNISVIYVRQEKVWSPTFSAFAVNDIQDFRDQDFRLVSLSSNGQIYSYIPCRISANCRLDVKKFPFDTQTCQIRISLPIFYYKEVKIMNEIYSGILTKEQIAQMGNSEWKILNLTSRVEVLQYHDAFGNIQLSIFELKMKRNPMFYIYMIVFPSFIINALSIIGVFIMKSDKMSRLNVGLTNIMTMTFILGVMADKIPKSGEIPLLGIYIIVNLFIMLFAVGITIVLTRLREWMIQKCHQHQKQTRIKEKFEEFVKQPLEICLIFALEMANVGNFVMIILYWITA
ncbi:unnamed protein product [Caenorhabditis angaria]|uniref:Neurotransmitter-gated ion-channel ligand-binding domain-containing protein n=1 Tax=Caenorhabditis angaria TaxID=860376 RepID=A0A9P1IY29_9PELO|nr:unnamed protein product [Caenorhabditis angaria]